MQFKQFLITEADEQLARWNEYLNDVPMLNSAVKVLKRIEAKGFDAYIVGGAVRDLILGEPIHDCDIATNCPIDVLDNMFKTHDIGKNRDFGIIVATVDGHTFEIAQFREDGTYLDGRRPESVKIVMSFKDDASRRDFTINSMGVDKDGNIIDYFDGKKDIQNKLIRTVGNPKDRFQEDYLRMLRVARADNFARGENFIYHDDFEKIVDKAIEIKEKWGSKTAEKVMKIIDGNHVMSLTGLKPGRQVGDIIKKATEWVIDNGVTDSDKIDDYIRSLK